MGISLRLDFIERTITAASDSPKDKQQSKMQTFHKIALLFACVALCASQNQAQEVPDRAVCEAEMDDVCPAPGVTGGQRLKQINQAKKRANARCYAFLSDYASSSLSSCDLGLIANKDSKAETVGDVL